jgi:hypothetical protein
MSQREEQWFLMDKRLIFASEDEKVFNEWVASLDGLIKIITNE